MSFVVEVKNLTKTYGSKKAVDNISFSIMEGEIFGIVGPNGAGKTTTLECIEGLRTPDAGSIRVLDFNPLTDRRKMYEYIGVQLQETSYPDRLKVWEICRLFSSFYKNPIPYKELLHTFELDDKANNYITKLSGGEKQKLSIVLSLIPNPKIVFLDELTTGLDPAARRNMWKYIEKLREKGITVCLTSHYMEEVEYLCDRVAIINQGKIVAMDSVNNLIKSFGSATEIVFTSERVDFEKLEKLKNVKKVEKHNGEVHVLGEGNNILSEVIDFLQKEGIKYSDLRVKSSGLEDVFLKLTGSEFEKED
ncbi:MAG: ABC transporter ATP-binding protein [Caldisericaceae bacterium]